MLFRKGFIMKKLIMIFCLLAVTANVWAYSGGSGTEQDPYYIATAEDLLELANTPADYDKYFFQVSTIDLADYSFDKAVIAPDTDDAPGFSGTKFTGTYIGGNNLIIHLNITGGDYCGLFGYVEDATIEYVKLTSVDIAAGSISGALCGYCSQSSIYRCYVSGVVDGSSDLGGFCGYNYKGTIAYSESLCSVSVAVEDSTGSNIGAFCGYNDEGILSYCYSHGSVTVGNYSTGIGGVCGRASGDIDHSYASGTVSADRSSSVGGLCGSVNDANISYCFSLCTVSAIDSVGGLCGYVGAGSTISDSYSQSSVTGVADSSTDIGGLCGAFYGDSVIDCYTASTITAAGAEVESVGGFCGGISEDISISGCFWDSEVCSTENGVADISDYTGLTAESTEAMISATIYTEAGWDVGSNKWLFSDGYYPQISVVGYMDDPFGPNEGTFDLGPSSHSIISADADISYNESGQSVTINTALDDAEWEVISNSDWITVVTDSGTGDGVISYSVTENTGNVPRRGYITVSTATASQPYTIIQRNAASLSKVVFKPGYSRASMTDQFIMTGRLNFQLSDLAGSGDFTFRIKQAYGEKHVVFESQIESDYDPSTYNVFYSKKRATENGDLTMFNYSFKNGNFVAYASGQDCSGWKTPLFIELEKDEVLDSFYVTDLVTLENGLDIDETLPDPNEIASVDGSYSMPSWPVQFLIGQDDYVSVLKNTISTNPITGRTFGGVVGKITTMVESSEVTEAVISWDGFEETIDLTKYGNRNYYYYRGAGVEGSSIYQAIFNLDACSFSVIVNGTNLGSADDFDIYLRK